MRRLGTLLTIGCTLLACKGGVQFDAGKPFPCDFSKGPGARDQDCPTQWVCGVANHCQLFVNEGISAALRTVTPDYSQAQLTYSPLLNSPVGAIALELPLPPPFSIFAVALDGGQLFSVTEGSISRPPPLPTTPTAMAFNRRNDALDFYTLNGDQLSVLRGGAQVPVLDSLQKPLDGASGLREASKGRSSLFVSHKSKDSTPVYGGEVIDDGGSAPVFNSFSPGALDVRPVSRRLLEATTDARIVPVIVTFTQMLYRTSLSPDVWQLLTADVSIPLTTSPQDVLLRHSLQADVWAVRYPSAPPGTEQVLSTWRLTRSSTPTLERAWDDCAPCPGAVVSTFTPFTGAGSPGVEVLCRYPKGPVIKVVRGSNVTAATQQCVVSNLEAPIDLNAIAVRSFGLGGTRPVLDESIGSSIAIAGNQGQIWQGGSLSTLVPIFLDRVPLGAASFNSRPIALTPGYFALANPDAGMAVVTLSELGLPSGSSLETPIEGLNGWFILNTGDVAVLDGGLSSDEGLPPVQFGPRLLNQQGSAAQGPFQARAFTENDGGTSFVATAYDSVYLYEGIDSSQLTPVPQQLEALNSQLTPVPNAPIVSLALDSTPPAGTRVQGYLVNPQNLYKISLGGAPVHWTQTPLFVGNTRPLKVWVDALTQYGRVGFQDGTIYTLPGAFPMVDALPSVDGGSDQVIDFASLGVWPVALAESGLYQASFSPDAGSGALMNWRKVLSLPSNFPTTFQEGKLLVQSEAINGQPVEILYVFSHAGQVFRTGSVPVPVSTPAP